MAVSFKEMLAARKASENNVVGATTTTATSTLRALGFQATSTEATLTSNGESYYINGIINGNQRVTAFFRYHKEDFRLVEALTQEPKAWVLMLDKPAVSNGKNINVYPEALDNAVVDASTIKLDSKLGTALAELIG